MTRDLKEIKADLNEIISYGESGTDDDIYAGGVPSTNPNATLAEALLALIEFLEETYEEANRCTSMV